MNQDDQASCCMVLLPACVMQNCLKFKHTVILIYTQSMETRKNRVDFALLLQGRIDVKAKVSVSRSVACTIRLPVSIVCIAIHACMHALYSTNSRLLVYLSCKSP